MKKLSEWSDNELSNLFKNATDIISKNKPQISSLLLLFQPVTATILGVYFFSETLLLGQFIGVIILLIGIYFAGLSERLNRGNQ